MPQAAPRHLNLGVAALLSLIIPGAGQMYKGEVGMGLVLLIITPISYLMLFVPGIIVHLIVIFDAARSKPIQPSS